ncbi:MAG: AMP-binding protein, partial [Solirubrobacterales bacterium]|nr:AMP-binding protein [Solirubrobacterales bacterium]
TTDWRRLWALLDSSAATVMQATPATWRMLIEAGWPGKPGLKALCGGEALPLALADELVQRGVELWNMYGPTETTIWSTVQRVTTQGEPLSIGRPIANTTLFILDCRGQPTPVGVPGELHIGGAGLARGYRNRPELTAERFVANRFDPSPHARVYKTGDLARYRPDGSVEFLGRLDNQVKIRGYRIELGEIETQLSQHPAVAAAVARAHAERSGDNALVAYVIPSGPMPSGTELRRFLAQKLPAYMIPPTYVTLDAFPLTPNGKVDRKALPRPEVWGTEPVAEYTAPSTELEQRLAELWAELLEHDRIGVHDDFFDLGGHSLLAARMIGRIHSQLDVQLPLRALFEAPTVVGLSERIEAMQAQAEQAEKPREEPPPLVPIARVRRTSFAQDRFLFIDQLAGPTSAYNIPWPLRLKGELDVVALGRALSEIVRRHEALRTRFVVQDGRRVQLIDARRDVDLHPTDLSSRPDAELVARELVDEQTQMPFDLGRGPLLRASLLHLGARDHVLAIVAHHIAADGWSKAVLFRELDALYRAYAAGLPSPLPEPPVQYGDYAEWERSWLTGDHLAAELEHWRAELEGAPTVLELPADRPRPAVPTLAGAWHRTVIPAEVVDAIRALGRREGATTFMTILAALDVFLHRYSGQEEILVGTPVDTRGAPGLEAAIGAFVNTVVIRGDLSGQPSFNEVLGRVRTRTLDALAHHDVPFERVVDTVAEDRDLSRHPLCQVLLAVDPA